jgi:hypothetical protein
MTIKKVDEAAEVSPADQAVPVRAKPLGLIQTHEGVLWVVMDDGRLMKRERDKNDFTHNPQMVWVEVPGPV